MVAGFPAPAFSVVGFPGAKAITNEELLELDVTVLVPADPEQTRGAMRWAAGAGKLAGYTAGAMKLYARRGMLPAFKVGREWRFKRSDVLTWMATPR